MNYKKIIPSRALRIKILCMLDWVPSRPMLKFQYLIHNGRRLNLKDPRRFSEKLQLYKLNYHNPLMLPCTDKYAVREVVEDAGLSGILIPLIGVYDRAEDIDLYRLPNSFVAKTTDGGGGNEVFICKDKSKIDPKEFVSKLQKWMSAPKATSSVSREWAYQNGLPRRIVVEELINPAKGETDLKDYKFFCFDGKVKFVYCISDRKLGQSAALGIYTPDFKKIPAYRVDERPQFEAEPVPENYQEMIKIAEKLSEPFPHVRVDLYNVDGRIYFGELTFYDGGGYMEYTPDSFDFEAGSYFNISSFK